VNPLQENLMRAIRYVVLAVVVSAAFVGCKKGGGYMTEPDVAAATP
jgi:hypothetical protein